MGDETEGKEGLAFVETLAEKVNTELTQEAYVLAVMESAHYKLLLADMEGTKVAIDKSSKILEGLDSVDLAVHAAFYRVSGDYYKVSSILFPAVHAANTGRKGTSGLCRLLQELVTLPRVHQHRDGPLCDRAHISCRRSWHLSSPRQHLQLW